MTITARLNAAGRFTAAGAGSLSAVTVPDDAGWSALKLGAGGFITGISIANDGTKVVRADTYGAFIYDASAPNPGNTGGTGAWRQLVTSSSMPVADVSSAYYYSQSGCYEVVIAPSDSNRIYMYIFGYVFKSTDKGVTFTRTAFTQRLLVPQGSSDRMIGPFMAVDPQNPDILYVGSDTNGVFKTSNGGTSFSSVSGLATATPAAIAGYMIAFDPSSSVVSSALQTIYISVYGTGVYRSTNGGSTFTLTTSGPTTHNSMACGVDGVLWHADRSGAAQNARKFSGGTWTLQSALGGTSWQVVVPDPNNAGHVYLISNFNYTMSYSANNGTSWSSNFNTVGTRTSADIPWITDASNYQDYTQAPAAFDPAVSNTMWMAEGKGVLKANPSTGTSFTWAFTPAGIENLVVTWIVSPPSGTPNVFVRDRMQFLLNDLDVFPSVHGGPSPATNDIVHGYSGDWASASPSTIAILANSSIAEHSGYSTDGGSTWTNFGSTTPRTGGGFGGCIAASSATNFVWCPGQSPANIYFTTNTGSSWTASTVSGITTGWADSEFLDRQIICADRVTANTFYAYNNQTGSEGIYKSTNSGATFTLVHAGNFSGHSESSFNARLRSVPGQAGHLFWSGGIMGSGTTVTGDQLRRSTDGGVNWSNVTNMTAHAFGFGATAPSASYPTVYVAGFLSGVWGIYRSIDNCSTWTMLDDFPLGNYDWVTAVEGDANTYGVVYIGYAGSGGAYYA